MTEKCSSIACLEKPIIEIVAWDNVTLDTHMFLCRKHWEEKALEEPQQLKMRIIRVIEDIRAYL